MLVAAQVLCKGGLEARHGSQLLCQAVCRCPSLAHSRVQLGKLTRESPLQTRSRRLNLKEGTDILDVAPNMLARNMLVCD